MLHSFEVVVWQFSTYKTSNVTGSEQNDKCKIMPTARAIRMYCKWDIFFNFDPQNLEFFVSIANSYSSKTLRSILGTVNWAKRKNIVSTVTREPCSIVKSSNDFVAILVKSLP